MQYEDGPVVDRKAAKGSIEGVRIGGSVGQRSLG